MSSSAHDTHGVARLGPVVGEGHSVAIGDEDRGLDLPVLAHTTGDGERGAREGGKAARHAVHLNGRAPPAILQSIICLVIAVVVESVNEDVRGCVEAFGGALEEGLLRLLALQLLRNNEIEKKGM